MPPIDVLINVFSKPWQTALSLLSLLEYSGQHIDKIYFHEEPANSSFERRSHDALLRYLENRGNRVVHFRPQYWLGVEPVEVEKLHEPAYRLSLRYQYGFEHSDKQHVLLLHNDAVVHSDVVGPLLENIQGHSGIGEIGQCWWCPAGQKGLCLEHHYERFRPSYDELMQLYAEGFHPKERRAYHYGLGEQFRAAAWPLPECRLNEWCALIDREKTLPHVLPLGTAMPLGAHMASGAHIGENFDEPVNLDTGVQWFRDLVHQGHSFVHYDIYQHISHAKGGHGALLNAETYVHKELQAKTHIAKHYPDFYSNCPK